MIVGCKYTKVDTINTDLRISYPNNPKEEALVFVKATVTISGKNLPPATLDLIRPGQAWSDMIQDALIPLSEVLQRYAEELLGDPHADDETLEVLL